MQNVVLMIACLAYLLDAQRTRYQLGRARRMQVSAEQLQREARAERWDTLKPRRRARIEGAFDARDALARFLLTCFWVPAFNPSCPEGYAAKHTILSRLRYQGPQRTSILRSCSKEESGSLVAADEMTGAASSPESDLAATRRQLDLDFVKIGFPAFCQFTAEPLARLVDTAYLGRLGPTALGGAGVAIAAQYSIAKLYNDPLLRSTISIVAAQDGRGRENRANAVSTALLLALVVGLAQGLCYYLFAAPILTGYNVGPASSMRSEALNYLRVCAVGAPTTTVWLVINGIFRGLGDTFTPLLWSVVFTGLNAILDPFFIFNLGMGAAGAAAGTAISQTIALIPLLIAVHRKLYGTSQEPVPFFKLFRPAGGIRGLRNVLQLYLKAGGLIFFRTIAKITAYSVAAREAACLGAVAAAAHNLCFQLGVATTQICESLAIATQTLLARQLGSSTAKSKADDASDSKVATPRPAVVRHIVKRGVLAGLFASSALACLTWIQREGVFAGLTTNKDVSDASIALLPWVLLCQVLKGLAYPVNGALMGALDWSASACTMWAAQLSSLGTVFFFSDGGRNVLSLVNLWTALAVLFSVQVVMGLARILSGTGPWAVLRPPAASKSTFAALPGGNATSALPAGNATSAAE